MAKKKRILIIGRHPPIMEKVIALLEKNGYDATGANQNEEAIDLFKVGNFDAVVIGGGVDSESKSLFHNIFPAINSAIKILDAHPNTILGDLKAQLG
jgi:CheY-like chemotaxis protein